VAESAVGLQGRGGDVLSRTLLLARLECRCLVVAARIGLPVPFPDLLPSRRCYGVAETGGARDRGHDLKRGVRTVVAAILAPVLDQHYAYREERADSAGSRSSRMREPKLSTSGFCHSEPGSISAGPRAGEPTPICELYRSG
jgi:hypothetical protein